MKKFEYKTISAPRNSELDAIGAEGWELVSVVYFTCSAGFYFKRPIEPSQKPDTANGWRPIETAPVDGTSVLLYAEPSTICPGHYSQGDCDEWLGDYMYSGKNVFYGDQPTFWKPLDYPNVGSGL